MRVLIFIVVLASLLLAGCTGEKMNKKAVLETNMGTITLELWEETMPITTKNFIDLAQKGFYDSTRFHRVIPNFMIQGGDPLSRDILQKGKWGMGDPGYKIKDEFAAGSSNVRGTIAMANAGPNTGGSQFFINVVDNKYLDGKHPVFGRVVGGMDVVDKIQKLPRDALDRPLQDVVIKTLRIE